MSRTPLLPDFPRPLLFAHRGASSIAPENTLASYRAARKAGAPGIELDVHLCASGEIVVHHDDSLKRTCGLDRKVEDVSFAELRKLSAGAWFGSEFLGERVPLLEEVLDEFSPDLYIDIEIKSRSSSGDPLPEKLAEYLRKRNARNVTISSFNPIALKLFKKAAPEYPTAVIWCADSELPWFLRRGEGRYLSGCDYLKPIHSKVSVASQFLEKTLEGRPVVPWTVDDEATAERVLARGCAGIISNRPQDLVGLIAAKSR